MSKSVNLAFCIFLFILVMSGCGKKDESAQTNGKTEKTGTTVEDKNITAETPLYIEFNVEGSITGKMKGWYKSKKHRSEFDMKKDGVPMKMTSYMDGTAVYMVTEAAGKKTGIKMDVKSFSEQSDKKGEIDISSWRDKLKQDYEKVGTAEVMGKMCDVYKHKQQETKLYVYKDYLPLKIESGKFIMTAEKYEVDVKIPDDMFTPPADVEYIDMSEMMKGIENMKDMKNLKGKTKEMEEMMKKYAK